MNNMELSQVFIALLLNFLDIITGIISALKNKQLKSSALRDGLFKKCGFIFCYLLAIIIDNYGIYIGFSLSISILSVIVTYVAFTEIVSIIENICKINSDLVPDRLKELFHVNGKDD